MFFTPGYVKEAKERRQLIRKIYFYRRSQLAEADLEALAEMAASFKTELKRRNSATSKGALEKLFAESDRLLARVGGHYFKHFHLFDNVETLVVAAILAIGIRSYFLQPFKIPTNSMWPTYHGMVYTLRSDARPDSVLEKVWKLAALGTQRYRMVAPADGEVRIPVNRDSFYYETVTRPMLGVVPVQQREYVFYVGETPVTLNVPLEFSMDRLILEKFFNGGKTAIRADRDGLVSTGVQVRAGEAILDFDLEGGDMLFADRFTYNFSPPKIGDPIVFRTRGIPGLTALYGGVPDDKYYIKRLVGFPGDKLRIEGSTLFRNGKPIEGSGIFTKDSKREAPYPGYQAFYDLANGATATVPAGTFYGFGDNSPESLDSRAWGGLPQDQLIGRAVFIYYPFSARWGLSK